MDKAKDVFYFFSQNSVFAVSEEYFLQQKNKQKEQAEISNCSENDEVFLNEL